MFNPVTYKVPDSRDRLAIRQWWVAFLFLPLLAALLGSLFAGLWKAWGPMGDMVFAVAGVLVYVWISKDSFTELSDKGLVMVTALSGGLAGVLTGSYLNYPPSPPRVSPEVYQSKWAPEVFHGDWFTQARTPTLITLVLIQIAIFLVARRNFPRPKPRDEEPINPESCHPD